jgi:ech hydrogenase subunit F
MFKMTPALLRNFFSRRATRRYPLVSRPPFANTRGALQNDIATCTFCGICAAKCPSQCIVVDKKSATWQCDPFACICCGICVEQCKSGSLRLSPLYRPAAVSRERILLQGMAPKTTAERPVQGPEPL